MITVRIRTSKLILELLRTNPENIKDPEKRLKYVKNSLEHYNQHISLFDIKNEDDIDYAMLLAKQTYKNFVG